MIWKISEWKPRKEFSVNELKKLWSFSIYVFASSSVNQIVQQLDALIIGKLFTARTLGFFTRANSLNKLIIQNSSASISKIFFPTLAQVKDQTTRFENIYLRVIDLVAAAAIYFTAILFLIGEELIIGLFGEKWSPSIPIFQILILRGFTFPINAMIINAFLAKGKSKANFYYSNLRQVLQLIPFLVAYFMGFYAFLYASVIVAVCAWLGNTVAARLSLGISLLAQLKPVLLYIIFSILLVVILDKSMDSGINYILALVQALLFSLLFFLLLRITNAPLLKEGTILFQRLKSAFK